jgi:hypothetical protein
MTLDPGVLAVMMILSRSTPWQEVCIPVNEAGTVVHYCDEYQGWNETEWFADEENPGVFYMRTLDASWAISCFDIMLKAPGDYCDVGNTRMTIFFEGYGLKFEPR